LSDAENLSKEEQKLRLILENIVNSTTGIRNVILLDSSGITLVSVSKFTTNGGDWSVEKIGAIGGAVFQAAQEQGEILGYGGIKIQITEYDKGFLFGTKVGDGILVLATDSLVQIGILKMVLQKWAPKIKAILSSYLAVDQKALSQELRSLFTPDDFEMF